MLGVVFIVLGIMSLFIDGGDWFNASYGVVSGVGLLGIDYRRGTECVISRAQGLRTRLPHDFFQLGWTRCWCNAQGQAGMGRIGYIPRQ